MRVFLAAIPAAVLALSVLAPGSALAAAGTGGDAWHDPFKHDRAVQLRDDKASQPRRRVARATISDIDEEHYEVEQTRPKRGHRADRRVHSKRHGSRTKQARTKQARSGRGVSRYERRASQRRGKLARLPVRGHKVQARPAGSAQNGIASYYWQGQRLATGGWFNPDGISAAHRTLPFGTRVRVTHLRNGRSVDVRINDRGPYIGGRIIDLSRGAARMIGMTAQGIAQVRVTILGR
jgi:rare lipoprotein A